MANDEELQRQEVRVLFVDDEESILKSLSRLFLDEEFPVTVISSPVEALQYLQEADDVGVIVSDQRMPVMEGVEFLERARLVRPDALRLVLTGYADISATMAAINRGGASRYITKPWNDDELVQTIRDSVSQYLLQEENRRLTAIVNRQNEELKEWNTNLKQRVLEQTSDLRKKHENLQVLIERLSSNFAATLTAFSRLIDFGGKKQHADNVAKLAENIAKHLNLPATEIQTIRNAALLHDIGELGVSADILKKEMGEMTPAELKEYMQHPVRGQTAIDAIEELREAGVLIRHHHENYDGKGGPDRLRGEDIPLGARILAIADYIDMEMQKLHGPTAFDFISKKVSFEIGKKLDPNLHKPALKFARYIYFQGRDDSGKTHLGEREMSPVDLTPGLILSRDICSGTGVLLLNQNIRLDAAKIAAIRRFYLLDPPPHGVFVET